MSRSGYTDDCEYLDLYRETVRRTIAGKRGQAFLTEMAAAMDAMTEKILIANELIDSEGAVCAIGSVCKSRGLDVSKIDYEDPESVADALGISRSLAAEIAYLNDEEWRWSQLETPEARWKRMREWVESNLIGRHVGVMVKISGTPGRT